MQGFKCVLLSVAAGTTLSSAAFAQTNLTDSTGPLKGTPVTLNDIQGGDYRRGGYSSRVDLEVYQIGTPSETGGNWAATNGFAGNTYDDLNFGGPYTDNTVPLAINGMSIGVLNTAANTAANIYTRQNYYPNHDNAAAGFAYSGTPLAGNDLNWGAGWGGAANSFQYWPGSITFNGVIATLSNADVFNGGPTDRTAGLKVEMFTDAALTVRASTRAFIRRTAFAGHKVGSSDTFGWFSGSAAEAATADIAQASRSGGGNLASHNYDQTAVPLPPPPPGYDAGNCRASFLGLQGTGFAPPEPPATPLTLADGTTTVSNITIANNSAAVFEINIANGALDGSSTFLDIDTEGSTGDFAVAVYDANAASATYSNVAQFDRDSGSGVNGMLSFGMGRRAAVGDGRQYDGRNFFPFGTAGIGAGRYFVVVAPNNTAFGDGWAFGANGTGGTATLRITTNVVSLTPLTASVPPAIDPLDEIVPSPLVAPGGQIPLVGLSAYLPRWLHFTTCVDASDANPVTFDWTGSDDQAGLSVTFFDGNGNLVAQQIAPDGPGAPPPAFVFNSSNPLPAGQYYAAVTYNTVQIQTNNPTTNGRWHLRSIEGNNGFESAGGIFVTNAECAPTCPGNICGPADYNGDGDVGTDQDIEAFFACLGGNCCATCFCQGADFNGDGDVGTDQDIEAYFRVLGGGNC